MASKKSQAVTGNSALSVAISGLKSSFDDSPLVQMDPDSLRESTPHISTGCVSIDYLIGGKPNQYGVAPCPGYPKGKIINLYGSAGAGKTTLALTTAAEVIRRGGTVAYIDFEYEMDPRWAQTIGVPIGDTSKFALFNPETLEDGMQIMIHMAKSGVDLIVVDSVGAGVPRQAKEQSVSEISDSLRPGLVAQKWSIVLPKYKEILAKTGSVCLGISQLRKTMGSMGGNGPDSAPQGGEAWKFYSNIRMMLRLLQKEKSKVFDPLTGKVEEKVTGAQVIAKLDKNKVGASVHQEAKFYLASGYGIDNTRTVLDLAIGLKIINKGGAWFTWPGHPSGEVKVQGMEQLKDAVNSHPQGFQALWGQVQPKLHNIQPSDIPETESNPQLDLGEFETLLNS